MRSNPVTLVAIDDDPELLALVSVALGQDSDLEVIGVADPARAFEVVRSRRPQIVLVDLIMPVVSGMQLLEQIVAFDPAIDVILMTAHYTTESAVEAIQKGACDYLNKPFTAEQLRARIAPLAIEASAGGARKPSMKSCWKPTASRGSSDGARRCWMSSRVSGGSRRTSGRYC